MAAFPSSSRRRSTRTRCSSAGPARTGPTRSAARHGSSPSTPRTGKLKWTFDALPERQVEDRPAPPMSGPRMSVDPESGILYLPVSSPSPNYYGGDRKEKLPLATSVTALDADTGKVIWSRQLVHHDIWDYDTNAAPTLVDIQKDGKTIPALVQIIQAGLPLRPQPPDRRADLSDRGAARAASPTCRAKQASPTQPYVADAAAGRSPTSGRASSTLADVVSFGDCSRKADELRYDGRFTPPSLQGLHRLSGDRGRHRMGRRRGRSDDRHLCGQHAPASCRSTS